MNLAFFLHNQSVKILLLLPFFEDCFIWNIQLIRHFVLIIEAKDSCTLQENSFLQFTYFGLFANGLIVFLVVSLW